MTEAMDPKGTARFVLTAAAVFAACCVATAVATISFVRLVGASGVLAAPAGSVRAGVVAVQVTAVLYTLAAIVTAIAVVRWVYVTNRNAQTWSPHVGITPGWAVGWFFVPIANLWKPFEGVRETYQASVDPAEPAGVPVPVILRLWWGGWIAGTIMSNLPRLLLREHSLANSIAQLRWECVTMAVIVAQTLALMAVVRLVTRAQRARLASAVADVFS